MQEWDPYLKLREPWLLEAEPDAPLFIDSPPPLEDELFSSFDHYSPVVEAEQITREAAAWDAYGSTPETTGSAHFEAAAIGGVALSAAAIGGEQSGSDGPGASAGGEGSE